jgi:hypothetical protein
MKELYKKLQTIREKIGILTKNKKNFYLNSTYLDINKLIEQLSPLLEEQNILLLQPIEGNRVTSILIDLDSEKDIRSSIDIPLMTDPQRIGSAITYFRRYTLQSLLALQVEDDDGNKAVQKDTEKKEKKQLNILDEENNLTKEWLNVMEAINDKRIKSVEDVKKFYKISKEVEQKIIKNL